MALGMGGKDGAIKTGKLERMKWHYVYDGSMRVTDIYEASADAAHAATCMRTRYTYSGTTIYIVNALETTGTWDSSWDIT
jgi:uncharacterized membrane protein